MSTTPGNDNHGPGGHGAHDEHQHHILPNKTALMIGATLLCLTVITVAVAHVDLGRLNFIVAMLIATAKAMLVALFFMGLYYDRKENGIIFVTSFVFLFIFMVLTSTDIFFRGDVYVKAGDLAKSMAAGNAQVSKLKTPWVSTPELVTHGRELFVQNCVTCHGDKGEGNGVAAAALNPQPRNFTQNLGWKNGRRPTAVFKTLKEGIGGSAMASFSTLPVDDRWALAAYVLSLGPQPVPKDATGDYAAVGLDPTQPGGGGGTVEKSIPIEIAIQRMAVPERE